jgi:histidine ammonia-lyase
LNRTIELGSRRLAIADVVDVARHGAVVTVAPGALDLIARGRELVDAAALGEAPIYGVTSALGANTGRPLDASERALYQMHAVRARAVGVGPPMSEERVRAMMTARLAGMVRGGSGISLQVFEALVGLVNACVYPVIPAWGTISVGDLPPLSHLALLLIGEGEAFVDGVQVDGAQALAHANLAPVVLEPKDGLALVGTNAATVGSACLVLDETASLIARIDDIVALSCEGFRANLSPFGAGAQAARPAPGQAEAARRILTALAGSALMQEGAARRVQDPLSFRCIAPVHGAVLEALAHAAEHVEIELNGVADSPRVDVDARTIESTGNFHIPGFAIAHEALGLALVQLAAAMVERCVKMLSPATSDLPLQLTRHGPRQSGFATVQKTLTALLNDLRHWANPSCLDFLPVSERIEDHAPMAMHSVMKIDEMAKRLVYLAAIEGVIAAQAVDLRAPEVGATMGEGARATYDAVRERVAFLDNDRPLGPDIEKVADWLRAAI